MCNHCVLPLTIPPWTMVGMVSFTPTHHLAEHLTKPEGYLVAHGQHGNTNMITNYIPEMSDTQAPDCLIDAREWKP